MGPEAVSIGEIVVTRSTALPTRVDFPASGPKALRILPLLALSTICLYKLGLLLRDTMAQISGQTGMEVLSGGLLLLVLFVILVRVNLFLVYLLLPRQVEIDCDGELVQFRLFGVCRRRFSRSDIRSVDLATYDFHGRWLGFCCLNMGPHHPRIYLTCTVQGAGRSDQAITAGREIGALLAHEMNVPLRRYENVGLKWFHYGT